MSGQFRGKRLFGGRLYAGRLFGPVEQRNLPDVIPYAKGPKITPERKRRKDRDDDVLLFLLR